MEVSKAIEEKQIQAELKRPERKKFEEFCYLNKVK